MVQVLVRVSLIASQVILGQCVFTAPHLHPTCQQPPLILINLAMNASALTTELGNR